MVRYRLVLEYDGGPFAGWQRQSNGLSVQEVVERAVFAFCQQSVAVQGAGRTDAGVHALGQVAHLDLPRSHAPERVRDALNAHLRPYPVVMLRVERVDEYFHARFSAIERRYLYRIVNRRTPLTLERGRAWWVPAVLDTEAMETAAQCLVGRHDFSTFRASGCQADSPVRTLNVLSVSRQEDEILVAAHARSFLHHQVRNIVGTLRLVGEGRWTCTDLIQALTACDRRYGGPTAPACGLYLTGVGYRQEIETTS